LRTFLKTHQIKTWIIKQPFSKWAVLFISIFLIYNTLLHKKWSNNRVIIHDVSSYYSYLPAALIYQDFALKFRKDLPENEPVKGIWHNKKGDTVYQKMTVGMSYLYFPTFLIAHAYAKSSSAYAANGFSKPYQVAVAFNTLLIGLLGLLISRLLLLRFFTETVTTLVLVGVYLGSNLYYYITMAPGMTHPYSFLGIAAFLLIYLRWLDHPNNSRFMALCAIAGLLIVIRPTNALACMFPILMLMQKANRDRIFDFFKDRKKFVVMGVSVLILPLLPQMLYWQNVFGSPFAYSYTGEYFFFNKPHIVDGLFGWRKGLLLYTPIFAFAFIGLAIKFKSDIIIRISTVLVMSFIYVIFSWWCWWYGGYSTRALIEMYPFLMLGLGYFVTEISKKTKFLLPFFMLVMAFLIHQNIRFVNLYEKGIIHWDSMTKDAVKVIYWNDNVSSDYEERLIKPDYEKALREGEDL
jgi:hypothetical protein